MPNHTDTFGKDIVELIQWMHCSIVRENLHFGSGLLFFLLYITFSLSLKLKLFTTPAHLSPNQSKWSKVSGSASQSLSVESEDLQVLPESLKNGTIVSIF